MSEQMKNSIQKKYQVGVEAALEVMGGQMEALDYLPSDDGEKTNVRASPANSGHYSKNADHSAQRPGKG